MPQVRLAVEKSLSLAVVEPIHEEPLEVPQQKDQLFVPMAHHLLANKEVLLNEIEK